MQSALTSLYRSIARHRLYALLNIGGLALGIATFLVLFLFVRFETHYGRWLPDNDRLWQVHTSVAMPGFDPFENDTTSPHFLRLLRSDQPQVTGTRFVMGNGSVRKGVGAATERIIQGDAAFFRLLPYPAFVGDPVRAMQRPGAAVVTESVARSYFGSAANAMGRTLTITQAGKTEDHSVAAVLRDLPADTMYEAGIFLPIAPPDARDQGWSFGSDTVLLRLSDAAAAKSLEAQFTSFLRRHPMAEPIPGGRVVLSLQPVDSLHLRDGAAKTVTATLGLIGLVTLLVAIVNYVNLATARAGLRAREVALRKVLGATRRALVGQFLGESLAAAALAGLLGLALAELTLPMINAAGGTSLALRYGGADSILLPLALLVVGTGVIAGLYPALVLSQFQPAGVLASARAPGGGRAGARLRQALVLLQFTIAVALGAGTAVLVAQTQHVRNADLGFDQTGLMLVPSLGDKALDPGKRQRLLDAFLRVPGVTRASYAASTPAGGQYMLRSIKLQGGQSGNIPLAFNTVGIGFLKMMGVPFRAGRDFDARFASDDSSRDRRKNVVRFGNVILNESALRKVGLGTPAAAVGKLLRSDGHEETRVVGVVADMRFNGPKNGDDAMMYVWRPAPGDDSTGFVRFVGGATEVSTGLERAWHAIAPGVPFDAGTVQQARDAMFIRKDAQRMRLFTIGAMLALMIACIGLYGLAAFDTARRVREIGIRKTLGASTTEMLRMLVGQFLRPVVVATVLAWPIAFYAMRQWLAAFADRIALSPLYFLGAGAAALVIAAATVLAQSWRVARAEPARALRYE
ncbi:FtsX-like permease family protein [uncultured Sphingomonas sp.]|uniref:FtsX-like permease family protein n=2 Tax=Pseudomonadota TaxID=1224 RepID=UPI002594D17B|nr:FtsX-like permease family protein [uncultured Sphingomonas sp.]